MPVYEIKSFRGISDYEDKGIVGAFKFGSALDVRKRVDSLSCQQALVEETGVTFTGLIHFFVDGSDGNGYGFDNTGKIYKRDSDGDWSLVYTDSDGAIKGAYEWPASNGKSYLYWATATKLKRKELPGLSNWSDVNADGGWPKTDLTSADWHTMKDAGGDLIIANKSNLAAVGYDQSYSPNVLDLIPGNVVKTLVERHGRTIIGTTKPGSPNKGINAAIDTEVPLAQVGDDGELFFADMSDSIPVTRFPGGGRVNPGGVENDAQQVNFFEWAQAASADPDVNSWIDKKAIGNLALFGVFGADEGYGGIWSYGRKNKNHPFVLNLDYPFDADEIGAVKKVNGTLIFSYKIGSTYGVKAVDATAKQEATYQGLDLKAPSKVPANITAWNYAEVYTAPMPAGTAIKFWYRCDKTGDFIQALMEGGVTEFTATGETKAVFLIGSEGEIFEPQVVLTPTGNVSPSVDRLRVYFD